MCNLNDEIVHKNVALVFSFKAQDSHFPIQNLAQRALCGLSL